MGLPSFAQGDNCVYTCTWGPTWPRVRSDVDKLLCVRLANTQEEGTYLRGTGWSSRGDSTSVAPADILPFSTQLLSVFDGLLSLSYAATS